MADTFFFLSYARDIKDPYLVQFFNDLSTEVRLLEPDAVGFMDTEIPAGKEWDPMLAQALRECRAFVSVYAPAYFESEYCGREWQAFQDRQDDYAEGQADEDRGNPGLSIPVLWTPQRALEGRMPAVLPKIQFTEDDFGPEYVDVGLRQLVINDKYKDEYRTFVHKFAGRLVEAARAHPLPAAASLKSLEEIENPFSRKAQPDLGPLTGLGPRVVKFILVAASRNEISEAGFREVLDFYGQGGGLSWKPYWDEVTVEVGVEAQRMAGQWQLYSSVAPLGRDLIDSIREAERQNNIVVLIVDAWSLRLDTYRRLMNEWNRFSYYNCVLLVPWGRDAETRAARADLVDKLAETFPTRLLVSRDDPERKITSLDQFCFMDGIDTWDGLMAALHDSLNRVRTRISMVTPYVNPAGPGQRPPSIP